MGARDVVFTILAIDGASAKLARVGSEAEVLGGKMGKSGRAVSNAMNVIGLATAAVAVKSVELGAKFQSTMEQLATQAHVPQKQVDSLSQSVLGLAGKVGQGPDSLAEALYHIESSFASTGITGARAMHLLQTSAEGAKIGHADLVDVTNALDAAVVSGIPGVKNFDQAMGMLNATVGAGDMHMQDLADAFGTGAVAVVKNYGLSLRDVGSALAVFGDNNIRGAQAGTALRMTVQSLAVPAKGGAAALHELGLSQETLAKDMQSGGLIKAVADLHDRLDKAGLSGKKSGDVLTQAFGKKAGVGLTMLVDQFDRLKSKYVEIDKGAKGFGSSWAAQQKTLMQQWDQLKAGAEAVLTEIGLKLIPVVLDLGKKFGDAGDKLKPVINFIEQHTGVFGAMAVAIGTVIAAVKVWTIAQAALDVALDANPIGLIVIAIAGMVAAVVYLATHVKKIGDDFATWGRIIMLFVDAARQDFAQMAEIAGAAVHGIAAAWNALPGLFATVVGWLRDLPGKVEGFLSSLPGKVWAILKSAAEKGAYYFGFGLGTIVKLAMELPGKVIGFMQELPGKVWDIIKSLAVKGASAFASFVSAVAGKAASLAAQVPPFIASLVSRVVAFLAGLPGKAVAAIKPLPGLIKGAVSDAGTWLIEAGKAVVQGIVTGIGKAASSAVSAVKDLGGQLVSGFSNAVGWNSPAKKFIPIGSGIVEGVEVGLKSRFPTVYNLLAEFAQRISNIKVTAGVKNNLEKFAVGVEADMRAATTRLDNIKTTIDDQRKKVADLIKAKADYANQLTSGLTGGGTIAGIQLAMDTTDAEGNVVQADKVGSFISALQAKADAITRFGTDISALRAKGLSQSVLQQIEQSGLETGGALASALATATPKAIQQIDVLSKNVQDRSDLFGKRWAGQMYDAGIQAAEGIAKGLQSKEAEILATIRRLAQSIVREIKDTLKIKSPSGVMRDEVGAMIPAGLIAGITGGAGGVAAAMTSLVGTPGTVAARAGLTASATAANGASAGGTHVHIHMPAGFIGSPDQLATALSDVLQRARNRGTALAF